MTRRAAVAGRRAAAAAVLAALLGGCGAGRPPPGVHVGVHVEDVSAAELGRAAAGGADVVRTPFKWSDVEPVAGGRLRWARYDRLVGGAARAGMRVLPVIVGSPSWASDGVARPPTSAAALGRFRSFVAALVRRYGRGGSFWAAHPSIPRRDVTAWQVWNEPNSPHYSAGEPDPRRYARLLELTRDAIRRVDPRATIVLAGMSDTRLRRPGSEFLEQLYAVPGAARLFDVVATHPYGTTPADAAAVLRRVRAVMDRGGDRGKPIWVTELGWATGGPPGDPKVTSPAGQAERLAAAFDVLSAEAAADRVELVVWFDLRDRVPPAGADDRYWFHTGLFDREGRPKPAWTTFARLAGGEAGAAPLASRP